MTTRGPSGEELLYQLAVSRRWARLWKASAKQLKRRLDAVPSAPDSADTMEAIHDALEALDHITGEIRPPADLLAVKPSAALAQAPIASSSSSEETPPSSISTD